MICGIAGIAGIRQACTFMRPDAPVILAKPWCVASPGRAHSRLQADSIYMWLSGAGLGILVLGIAGQRGGKRHRAFRWAAESPFALMSRVAWRDTVGGSAWLGGP